MHIYPFINNFIYNTHNQKNEPQEELDENTKKKDSVIKLMFENAKKIYFYQ